jgi:hypothetical protein
VRHLMLFISALADGESNLQLVLLLCCGHRVIPLIVIAISAQRGGGVPAARVDGPPRAGTPHRPHHRTGCRTNGLFRVPASHSDWHAKQLHGLFPARTLCRARPAGSRETWTGCTKSRSDCSLLTHDSSLPAAPVLADHAMTSTGPFFKIRSKQCSKQAVLPGQASAAVRSSSSRL